jgi:broad specificity phosphatase PhoE
MRLYFVRHGQSVANVQMVISNRDLFHPLTELGRQQAEALAQSLAEVPVAALYSSPIVRAAQTAQIGEMISGFEPGGEKATPKTGAEGETKDQAATGAEGATGKPGETGETPPEGEGEGEKSPEYFAPRLLERNGDECHRHFDRHLSPFPSFQR